LEVLVQEVIAAITTSPLAMPWLAPSTGKRFPLASTLPSLSAVSAFCYIA
jgi:hypothetical protein